MAIHAPRRVIAGAAISISVAAVAGSGHGGAVTAVRAASAAVAETQRCPVPVLNVDPDFVTLNGAAFVAPSGARIPYAVTATEAEGGSNLVALRLTVSVQDPGGSKASDVQLTPANGLATGHGHSAVGLSLLAASSTGHGRVYVISWIAVFDNGIHPCSSYLPGQAPLTVAVLPNVGG